MLGLQYGMYGVWIKRKDKETIEGMKKYCLDILCVSETHLWGCEEKEVGWQSDGVPYLGVMNGRAKRWCGSDDFREPEGACEGIGKCIVIINERLHDENGEQVGNSSAGVHLYQR